jgi:hypothetical protein
MLLLASYCCCLLVWNGHGDGPVGSQHRPHGCNLLHDPHQDRAAARRFQLNAVAHHKRPCHKLHRGQHQAQTRFQILNAAFTCMSEALGEYRMLVECPEGDTSAVLSFER